MGVPHNLGYGTVPEATYQMSSDTIISGVENTGWVKDGPPQKFDQTHAVTFIHELEAVSPKFAGICNGVAASVAAGGVITHCTNTTHPWDGHYFGLNWLGTFSSPDGSITTVTILIRFDKVG